MQDKQCELYSRQYAQFVSKEVVKEAAARIFDDLRGTLSQYLKDNAVPGCEAQAERIMELLSDVEVRHYNEFKLQDVFEEVIER
ncbi:hypothetical protein [Fundidesulfovibrio terrae]|uniref:hypothetical protein n=1 Tax=Fundidesulfovibrio terrae TaxID=2922866 RepID=UPI001FAF7106|nr:hypothetical protein [Fundidesulfovibrio terrae]